MISDEKLQKALHYLATTDETCAMARGLMVGLEKQEKTILGVEYGSATGTVGDRDAAARTSDQYREWREKYETAVVDYEILRNKRNTASVIVEVWRSENANRRSGNL